jgi:hypothetical protein
LEGELLLVAKTSFGKGVSVPQDNSNLKGIRRIDSNKLIPGLLFIEPAHHAFCKLRKLASIIHPTLGIDMNQDLLTSRE